MNKEIVSIIPLALLAVFLVTNLDLITSGNSKEEFTITIHKCATGEKSKLKACPADVTSVWDNCFGTYDGKKGKKNSIVELARSVYQDEVALYQGEWKNDLFHGCGIETIPSKGTYTGQFKNGLVEAFKGQKTKFLIISFSSDWLYTTKENKDIVIALNASGADVSYSEIITDKGHDSFLLDVPDFLKTIKSFIDSMYEKFKNEKRI